MSLLAALLLALGDEAKLQYEIVDKAGWRGDREIPASAVETYSYDADSDTVRVSVKFDRRGFAPLPPMLALAARHGFPVEFDRKPRETDHHSPLGPLWGVDDAEGFAWRIKGLGKYVFGRAELGPGAVPPGLQKELDTEVEKAISAGHLAPWLFLVNVPGSGADDRGDVYWDNPGETLYLLAELAPVLPEAEREKLRAFLKTEREGFPPERHATVPYAQGARREAAGPDANLIKKWEEKVLAHRTKGRVPVWNLYGLARAAETLGEKPSKETMDLCRAIVAASLDHRDWATLYWRRGHTPAFNAVHGVNGLFAGFVGTIRLARLAGDREAEALGWGMLARMAALRFAMGKYTQYLHDSRQFNVDYGFGAGHGEVRPEQFAIRVETDPKKHALPDDPAWWTKKRQGSWIGELVSWNWKRPVDNVRQVHRLDETGVDLWEWAGVDCNGNGQKRGLDPRHYWYNRTTPHLLPFRDMVPETGQFLADHLKPETEAYCARVAENLPHWYAAYSEAILGAEIGFNPPCDAYGHFLARAWVLGEKGTALERYADVPWLARGDLYHLHKLVEAVKACRGRSWRSR